MPFLVKLLQARRKVPPEIQPFADVLRNAQAPPSRVHERSGVFANGKRRPM
jgi:hypothetical protein